MFVCESVAWCCCIPLPYISHEKGVCLCVFVYACWHFFPMALRRTQQWLYAPMLSGWSLISVTACWKLIHTHSRNAEAVSLITSLHSFALAYMWDYYISDLFLASNLNISKKVCSPQERGRSDHFWILSILPFIYHIKKKKKYTVFVFKKKCILWYLQCHLVCLQQPNTGIEFGVGTFDRAALPAFGLLLWGDVI